MFRTFLSRYGHRLTAVLLRLAALVLFALSLIRVLRIPVTVDEAPIRTDLPLTYWDFITLKRITANTHILNSVLRKVFMDTFGNTPLTLRLPSLLAHAVFLWLCIRICERLFNNAVWRIGVFALLALNPFVFEFWGYSRGYGLAVACMSGAIMALISFVRNGDTRRAWMALLCGALAVWSNFALLNFFLPLCAVLLLESGLREGSKKVLVSVAAAILVIGGILAVGIYGPINKLLFTKELYYGGDRGLVADTITSIARESMFRPDDAQPGVGMLVWSFVVLNLLSLGFYGFNVRRERKSAAFRTGFYLCLLLNLVFLSLVVQHALLGTKYLIDRTAIFIIPLGSLSVVYAIYLAGARAVRISAATIAVLAALQLYNFGNTLSLDSSHVWWHDNYNVIAIERLAERAKRMSRPMRLRVCWIQMPSMDYYIYTRYPKLFEPLEFDRNPPGPADTGYDYCYLPGDDAKALSPRYVLDSAFYNGSLILRRIDVKTN